MTTHRADSTVLTLGLLLAAVGCVSGEGDPPMGDAHIFPGIPVASPDYDPTLAPMAGAGVPAGQAGAPAAPGAPMAGAAPPAAPSGTAGAAGAPATPSGTAGAAGAPATPSAGSAGADPTTPPETGAAGEPAVDPVLPTAGETGGATSPDEPASTGSPGTLTIQFTTVDQRGRYAPRNYGAVWIETGSGTFVKTLKRWAGIHVGDLRTWNAASGGWGFFGFGGNAADQVDVISVATQRSHGAHDLTWDMVDNDGAVVPDGAYKLSIEIADGSANATSIPFDKGPTPVDVSIPSQNPVSNLTLTYQP